MLVIDDLTQAIYDALEFNKNYEGELPFPLPPESKAYAEGLITALQNSIISLPVVTGTAGAPGPFTGAATGGIITNVISSVMTNIIKDVGGFAGSAYVFANLTTENNIVCTYMMTGIVSFAMGTITGNSTAQYIPPPGSSIPGILQNGQAINGTVSGYSGSALAGQILAALSGQPGMGTGPFPDMVAIYTAICNYIMANAEVTFTSGKITGTFAGIAPTGDPIVGGLGINGVTS